jgi:iterative type I PKS product template protein
MAPQIHVARQHKISTTSCQQVVYEDIQHSEDTATIIVQTDLTHPKLWPVIEGHVMNQRVLVPSSLWADMAMTVADYIYRTLRPEAPEIGLNVCAVEIHKTMMAQVPPPAEGQHVQLESHADLSAGEMTVKIRSVTWDGTLIAEHGHGLVKFEDATLWHAEWQRAQYLVQGQIDALHTKLATGGAHKILRGMAYKLFGVVAYGPKYQGMSSIILDKYDTEATASIDFQYTPGVDGEFFCSPYHVDNLCHLSGFIVNASDVTSDEPLLYISHGWESLKFLRPTEISADKTYTSYVRMMSQGNNVSAGDVYILEDGDIIAVLYGLKFQGISKKLMDILLPPVKKGAMSVKTTGSEMKKSRKSKVSFTA